MLKMIEEYSTTGNQEESARDVQSNERPAGRTLCHTYAKRCRGGVHGNAIGGDQGCTNGWKPSSPPTLTSPDA
jgi:hypothetical protein